MSDLSNLRVKRSVFEKKSIEAADNPIIGLLFQSKTKSKQELLQQSLPIFCTSEWVLGALQSLPDLPSHFLTLDSESGEIFGRSYGDSRL